MQWSDHSLDNLDILHILGHLEHLDHNLDKLAAFVAGKHHSYIAHLVGRLVSHHLGTNMNKGTAGKMWKMDENGLL